jgi:CBS domain-containing protein
MPKWTGQPFHGSYLTPALEHATVADAMHPGILSCNPDATLTEVARMMATHHIHCVAVMGISQDAPNESRVWGIVSDVDVVRAGLRPGAEETARTLALKPMITVEATTPLREAGELMLSNGVSHAVVLDAATKNPTAILSTLDIAGVLAWGEA